MISQVQLKIDGTTIDPDAAKIRIESITTWAKDEPTRALFTLESTWPQTSDAWANKSCEIWINSGAGLALVFAGKIMRRVEAYDDQRGWTYGYEAAGMEIVGNECPVVSPFDGTGSVTFNQPPESPDYDPTFAGLSIGEMILLLLQETSTASFLTAYHVGKYYPPSATGAGYVIDSRTISDLTGVSSLLSILKPSKPTTFEGDNLFQAIRAVLQAVAPNHAMWVDYVYETAPAGPRVTRAYGVIRFTDCGTRSTEIPLTFGVDPNPQIQRNYAPCASRVLIRGGKNVQPMILTLSGGDLVEHFEHPGVYATNTAAKTAWKLSVWLDQDTRKVTGTCLCRRPNTLPGDPTDPTDITLADAGWLYINPDPAEAAGELAWGVDAWDQDSDHYGGHLYIHRTNGTGGTEWATRDVIGNTAQTAGGHSYLQLSADLATKDFDSFAMTARRWPGLNTWRRYKITTKTLDGANVARRAQTAFPALVPWVNSDGSVGSLTRSGIAEITVKIGTVANTAFVGFEIDRENESIIFDRPLVTFFGTNDKLITGGTTVDGVPDEIRVLLPVAQGVLEVAAPADVAGVPQYGGTCFTQDGIQRTRIVNNREWVSDVDNGQMTAWANRLHESMRDTIVEGSATRYGFYPVRGPGSWLSWSDPCYAAGTFGRLASDIRACTITWNHAGAPSPIITTYSLSNRRQAYAAQQPRVYHPCQYPIPRLPEPADFAAGVLISRSAGQIAGGNMESIREAAGGRGMNEASIAAAVTRGVQSDADRAMFAAIDAAASGAAQGRGNADAMNAANFGGNGSGNADAMNQANGFDDRGA